LIQIPPHFTTRGLNRQQDFGEPIITPRLAMSIRLNRTSQNLIEPQHPKDYTKKFITG
jgi:hypothetical protein